MNIGSLEKQLPNSAAKCSDRQMKQKRENGKEWSEKYAPDGKSYADTAAKGEGPSSSEGERGEEFQKGKNQLHVALLFIIDPLKGPHVSIMNM